MYSTFEYARARQDPPLTEAGIVGEEEFWERVTYFVKRVVPVAEEYKIRLGLHPQDPALPPGQPFCGVHRVLATVEGSSVHRDHASPYTACCSAGHAQRVDENPPKRFRGGSLFRQPREALRMEFRNIKGGFLKFQETFPDDET